MCQLGEPGDSVDEGTNRHAGTISSLVAILIIGALGHTAIRVISAEQAGYAGTGDHTDRSGRTHIAIEHRDKVAGGIVVLVAAGDTGTGDVISEGDIGCGGVIEGGIVEGGVVVEGVLEGGVGGCIIVREVIVGARGLAHAGDVLPEVEIRPNRAEDSYHASFGEDIDISGHSGAIVTRAPQCTKMGLPVGVSSWHHAMLHTSLSVVISVAIVRYSANIHQTALYYSLGSVITGTLCDTCSCSRVIIGI